MRLCRGRFNFRDFDSTGKPCKGPQILNVVLIHLARDNEYEVVAGMADCLLNRKSLGAWLAYLRRASSLSSTPRENTVN